MDVADALTAVRVCLDEIGVNDASLVGGSDDAELDTIIRSKLLDALTFVIGNADWSLLAPDAVISLQLSTESAVMDDGSTVTIGVTELPDTFLRLCYAKADSWSDYVTEPVYWTDREYRKLRNAVTTGYPDNPKAAIVRRHAGKPASQRLYIELYSVTGASDRFEVAYVSRPSITTSGGAESVSVPERLERAFVYYAAGLTLLTLRDEHADSLLNQALVMMGAQTRQRQ